MKKSLNLMSEKSRKRAELRSCLRLWSHVLVFTLAILSLIGVAQWRLLLHGQSTLASAEAEYEPVRELKKENGRLHKQIKTIEAAERIPLELSRDEPLLSLLTLASQAISHQDGSVYLEKVEIERGPLVADADEHPELTFEIQGVSVDGTAVTSLTDTLRQMGPFASVELNLSDVLRANGQEQSFSIQCAN